MSALLQLKDRSRAIEWVASYGKSTDSSSTIMADSVCDNRPRPLITTGRSIWAVTRKKNVGESDSQPGTEKSALADYTRSNHLWHHYTNMGQHNIRHDHLHLLVLLRLPQVHRVPHLLWRQAHNRQLQDTSSTFLSQLHRVIVYFEDELFILASRRHRQRN